MARYAIGETAEDRRTDRILKYHFDYKPQLNNAEIAKLVDCSRENVRQVLERVGAYSPRCMEKNREE